MICYYPKISTTRAFLTFISELGSASVEEYMANGAPVPSIRPDAERRDEDLECIHSPGSVAATSED